MSIITPWSAPSVFGARRPSCLTKPSTWREWHRGDDFQTNWTSSNLSLIAHKPFTCCLELTNFWRFGT